VCLLIVHGPEPAPSNRSSGSLCAHSQGGQNQHSLGQSVGRSIRALPGDRLDRRGHVVPWCGAHTWRSERPSEEEEAWSRVCGASKNKPKRPANTRLVATGSIDGGTLSAQTTVEDAEIFLDERTSSATRSGDELEPAVTHWPSHSPTHPGVFEMIDSLFLLASRVDISLTLLTSLWA
jgi:hypothetical protein